MTLHARLREILAALSASDPTCKRFGAAHHQYALLPPLDAAPVDGLPDDYVEYVTRMSAGGVGPYYGLLPADRAAQYLVTAPAGVSWHRALPITGALSGYLGVREQELGLPPGTLDGDALRGVLGDLGPGAIAVTTDDSPLFARGDRVDPCAACARALQGLGEQGLHGDVVAPGVPPLPAR